ETTPTGLKYARERLLSLLRKAHEEEPADVTVVFDARRAPPGATAEQDYRGIHVRFAVRYPEADDLLEELIRRCSAPHGLTVVSAGRRVRRGARRRGCGGRSCDDSLDWLGRSRREPRPHRAAVPDKPETATEEEAIYWRQAFADLEDDPRMHELFDIPWS